MPRHPLTNFEIQCYYKKEPRFEKPIEIPYSRNNLPQIQDRTYVINLDEYKSIGTHWIALYINGNNVIYFDSFRVEYYQKNKKNHRQQKYCNKYVKNTRK